MTTPPGGAPGGSAPSSISDAAWDRARQLIDTHDPQPRFGRRRSDQRRILEAIRYKLTVGCRWNDLPRALGDDSTVHRTYLRWQRLGILHEILAAVDGASPNGQP
ncbi:MAG: transposase [Chloroflexi bacterium]|nr:transposase [Chloroflexota bacterium]